MSRSIRVYTKIARPDAPGQLVGVRFQPEQLAALDRWIEQQSPEPSRPEAVRRLVDEALTKA
jgi:hypothetical protein